MILLNPDINKSLTIIKDFIFEWCFYFILMDRQEMIIAMNKAGKGRIPFLFIIDFEMKRCILSELGKKDDRMSFCIDDHYYSSVCDLKQTDFFFRKIPVSLKAYRERFDTVMKSIHRGDSFLINLTLPTPVSTNLSLEDIFIRSNAPYKLLLKDRFVCFSPECFVKITDGKIFSFPMKGTIDAAITNAERIILSDAKETAEHNTIVDLIRNDLGIIAKNVMVEKFRYFNRIKTNGKELLQVSSSISGQLPSDWIEILGDIVFTLLPAGSVTGAPKKSTVEIIRAAEKEERGYYTGVWGIFDGSALNSAVMIRFIEQNPSGFYFRSGGGITANSIAENEYQELIDKVYVPFG